MDLLFSGLNGFRNKNQQTNNIDIIQPNLCHGWARHKNNFIKMSTLDIFFFSLGIVHLFVLTTSNIFCPGFFHFCKRVSLWLSPLQTSLKSLSWSLEGVQNSKKKIWLFLNLILHSPLLFLRWLHATYPWAHLYCLTTRGHLKGRRRRCLIDWLFPFSMEINTSKFSGLHLSLRLTRTSQRTWWGRKERRKW